MSKPLSSLVIEQLQKTISLKFRYTRFDNYIVQAFLGRLLLLTLVLCNIAEVQACVGASPAWTAHLEYDLMGRESLRRLLGGVESKTCYDLSGKLRRLTAGSYTAEFDYDLVGKLAAARYDETEVLYKLPDRIGNIYPDRLGKAASYERGRRLKEDKDWTYHFDGEGFLTQRISKHESRERYDWIRRKNVVESLTWTYTWDGAGQLVAVKNNDKVSLRFEYDALGRRTAKINAFGKAEGHTITRFLWDGDVPLHEWTYPLSQRPDTVDDSEGWRSYQTPEPQTELTTWIFDEGTFVPSAKLVGDRRYSIISDYLGTPVEAYDEQGRRVWQRELDIYGRTRIERGEVGLVPFLYQGQYLDTETGLAYNRFRYYSPETGAYISQDPIRLEAGLTNLYAYVHDTNAWVDPWGLSGRGGTLHQSIQKQLAKDLGDLGKSVGTEGQINLKNGKSRFGDVVVRNDAGDIIEVHQIGDMRTRGGFRPSSRERGAIMDIREALGDDVRIVFHDKKGRVTLIDPDKADDWKKPNKKHRKNSCG